MMARRPNPHAHHTAATNTDSKRDGYTLVELMIVVVIIGVLAALAVPAYRSFVNQARANEGVHVLTTIGMRQESYYAEFGTYVDLSPGGYPAGGDWTSIAGSFMPDATGQGSAGVVWPAAANSLNTELGIETNGRTYLSYQCAAGGPAAAANPFGAPTNMDRRQWWVAAALADLDDDGDYLTLELTSQSKSVWVSAEGGWE